MQLFFLSLNIMAKPWYAAFAMSLSLRLSLFAFTSTFAVWQALILPCSLVCATRLKYVSFSFRRCAQGWAKDWDLHCVNLSSNFTLYHESQASLNTNFFSQPPDNAKVVIIEIGNRKNASYQLLVFVERGRRCHEGALLQKL